MIEADHLSVTLGDTSILREVDMAVSPGTFLGLIGPNGAGKSTLLRTINGVVSPTAGEITVAGEDVHSLDPKAVSRLIATVPQDTAIAFDFDVRSVVAMGRTPYRGRLGGRDEAGAMAVERALKRTQTLQFADRPVGSLSGGERQRIVIARALAQETPVILLDEPTASLDINHQVRTLELIRDLVDCEAKTVVAAIHDLNLAAHYCDELVLLSEGSIVERGSPEDVLTENVLEAAFETGAVVTRHPITGSVYVAPIPGGPDLDRDGHVHVIGGGGTASRLLYLLTSTGFRVSVGALNEGDSDLTTARQFGLETIVIPPFTPVDDETASAVTSAVNEADITIVADIEIGEGNLANLEAAARSDQLLVVERRPIDERNYAGGQGRAAYRALRSSGVVVDEQEVLPAVERLLGSSQAETTFVDPVRLVDGGDETDGRANER